MEMDVVLCFASYEDKIGMYHNVTTSLTYFNKEEVLQEVNNYYKNINIEEFFLADTWTDDSENINNIIVKNYTENYIDFIDFIEELSEKIDSIENIDSDLYKYVNDNYFSGKGSIDDILEYISGNVTSYDTLDEIFTEFWTVEGNNIDSGFTSLFYWLNSDARMEFLSKNIINVECFDKYYTFNE